MSEAVPAKRVAVLAGLGLVLCLWLWPWLPAGLPRGAVLAAVPTGLGILVAALWPVAAGRRRWWSDTVLLGALWLGAFALVGAVLAWVAGNVALSLPLALGAGALGWALWIMFWRYWPLWAMAQRQGGGLTTLSAAGPGTWAVGRGLGLAASLFGLAAAGWTLASESALPPAWGAPLFTLLATAVVVLLQRHGELPDPPPAPIAVPPRSGWRAQSDEPEPEVSADPAIDHDEFLYASARTGKTDAALQLLADGADAHALPATDWADQRTLLMLASVLPDLRLLRALIERGVDVDQEHTGLTALLACTRDSWHGRVDAVTMLLANGADPRRVDRGGETALHHAARSTDPGVAAALLDAGAELSALNLEHQSPLAVACAAGNWRVARFLLERGAKPEMDGAQPALVAAAGADDDDPAGVRLLLKHKAKVDARDAQGRTALHEAIDAGHADVIAALLDAHARTDIADALGITAFLEAARAAQSVGLTALAGRPVDVHATDRDGRNAIALACVAGVEPERLRRLLTLGVAADQRDAAGRRPVEHALGGGHWPLVAVLDPDYPVPAGVAEGLAATTPALSPLERLRRALADHDWVDAAVAVQAPEAPAGAALGVLLADFADADGQVAFDWLLRRGARADIVLTDGDSVARRALRRGAEALPGLWRLVQAGQWPHGAGNLTLWLQVAGRNDGVERFALSLLDAGVDPFALSPSGECAVWLAVQHGHAVLLNALLQRGMPPEVRGGNGLSALHVAVQQGDETMIRALLRAGAQPTARAPDGQTAQGLALARNRRDLAAWLDWTPWALPGRPLRAADLPAAAMAGDLGAVARLLALGLPVDGTDQQGCTALLRAAGGGHVDVVRHLLDLGANAQIAARTGATPLSAAISMQRGDVVDALLGHGSNAEQPMPGGVTPLMLAAALGYPELVARLLRAGAHADVRDAQGISALHGAALFAFGARDKARALALLDTLLLAGAEPDAPNEAQQTPLLLALGARAETGASADEELVLAVAERLLAEGASLSVADGRGFTPLHLAALHGLRKVVAKLLKEGADATVRDRLGRTPRDVAVQRGLVDVAAEFDGPGAIAHSGRAPSLARFLRPREGE